MTRRATSKAAPRSPKRRPNIRFCRTLGTLSQSGVPILNALSVIKNATGNTVVAGAIGSVHNSIREGGTIAEPLRHARRLLGHGRAFLFCRSASSR